MHVIEFFTVFSLSAVDCRVGPTLFHMLTDDSRCVFVCVCFCTRVSLFSSFVLNGCTLCVHEFKSTGENEMHQMKNVHSHTHTWNKSIFFPEWKSYMQRKKNSEIVYKRRRLPSEM